MRLKKSLRFIYCLVFGVLLSSCSKDKQVPRDAVFKIVYVVNGTHVRLNYIDSNSVFQKDQVFTGSFRYEFRKGSGATVGISIFKVAIDDQIYSWEIYIDDKLCANAFSEGGAYFTVPQN